MTEDVKEMKSLAGRLADVSWPAVSWADEADILCLKERNLRLDGYEFRAYYSVRRMESVVVNILKIWGRYTVYLPFHVVAKAAKLFFGQENIVFLDGSEYIGVKPVFMEEDCRRVYSWFSVTDHAGNELPCVWETGTFNFEGVTYKICKAPQTFFDQLSPP